MTFAFTAPKSIAILRNGDHFLFVHDIPTVFVLFVSKDEVVTVEGK